MKGSLPISIDDAALKEFCQRWKITELSLFGSVVRDDFGPDSDVDVLVTFEPDATWTYFDWPAMQNELSEIFGGRPVDLLTHVSVQKSLNPYRRASILRDARTLYAA